MADNSAIPHLLVIPFPAQGHLLPLLDFCYILASRGGIAITIVTTPGNLHTLSPLLSLSPSVSPLVLPFPSIPSFPPSVENTHGLPLNLIPQLIHSLSSLLPSILLWSSSQINPPVAVLSDIFTSAWTVPLAESLSIPRLSFSPSGAFALSVIHQLWDQMPPNSDPDLIVSFPSLPFSPSFPLSHLSTLYRGYRSGDIISESVKNTFQSDARSHGIVINTFSHLESDFIDYLQAISPDRQIYAVGPLGGMAIERKSGGSSEDIITWLDRFSDDSVVYTCFGSQAVLSVAQVTVLASAIEASGVPIVWCVRDGAGIPAGFEERMTDQVLVVRGWAPQVEVLSHPAVGWFLTHCGWNSVLEAVVAGVALLTWPHGADQFMNALLMERAGLAVRVAEGGAALPDIKSLAEALAGTKTGMKNERKIADELRGIARGAMEEGGSSFRDLESLVVEFKRLAAKEKS